MIEDAPIIENSTKPELAQLREKIEARLNQSSASRLAELVTGLNLEDPNLVAHILEDQQRIRQKYSLPSLDLLWEDPAEYERQLKEKIDEVGASVRETSDCGTFFEDNPALAVYMDDTKTIGASVERTDEMYSPSLKALEHEFVHSVQDDQSPRMPIEVKEYEAYVANISNRMLAEKPTDALDALFGYFMRSFINTWYRLENEKLDIEDADNGPVWDDPRFFLEYIDKISDEDIQSLIDQIRKDEGIEAQLE